jgi:His Kinase A (phosphoacceptor) domain.
MESAMNQLSSKEIISSLTIIKGYSDLMLRTKLTAEQLNNYSQIINDEINLLEKSLAPILQKN